MSEKNTTSKEKKGRVQFLAAALTIATFFSSFTGQASAATITQLNASQIVADMGAGWNLGNQMEASSNGYPSETAWGNPTVTQALIDKVKAAGFKTIRIPVSYLNYIGNGQNYTISSSWLDRVQQVVNYAINDGLYVIINIHGDGYKSVAGSWLICDSSDQTTIKDKYQKVWQQIATRFQNYDQHLIYESMNEEFDGSYGNPTQPCYSNVNAYNQIFVDSVRQSGGNNGSRWLLIPGWNTNIDYTAGNYGFALPTDYYRSSSVPSNEKRIMISVHYYSPWDFAGEEDGNITQWGAAATNPSKTSTWGQEDYLNSQLKAMHDTFVAQGYPVVVGEYGSIDKTSFDSSNNTYRANFAKAVVSNAKNYGEVPVYWDNGANGQYGFGLFNRSSYAVTQQGIVTAIMAAIGSSSGSTYVKLKNRATGLYIDGMGRTSNGSNAGQYSSSSNYNQQWTIESYGSYYRIKDRATGLYIDGMGSTSNGSVAGQWSGSGSNNQQWSEVWSGSYVGFQNRATGLFLDGMGRTSNGSDLGQWSGSSSFNQQFQIVSP